MFAAIRRVCFLAFMLPIMSAGLAQAQVTIQQTPSVLVVKPSVGATIAGALLGTPAPNPNQPPVQGNNAGLAPYPSANGACQTGYIFDGRGYCVPYNSANNSAPVPNAPAPYGAQMCQPGYVFDGRGSCIAEPPAPQPGLNVPAGCPNGYVPNGQGGCMPPTSPQQDQPQPAPPSPPPAPAPAPAAQDTSGDCPAGYALDHDGNCSFASETNPYQK